MELYTKNKAFCFTKPKILFCFVQLKAIKNPFIKKTHSSLFVIQCEALVLGLRTKKPVKGPHFAALVCCLSVGYGSWATHQGMGVGFLIIEAMVRGSRTNWL